MELAYLLAVLSLTCLSGSAIDSVADDDIVDSSDSVYQLPVQHSFEFDSGKVTALPNFKNRGILTIKFGRSGGSATAVSFAQESLEAADKQALLDAASSPDFDSAGEVIYRIRVPSSMRQAKADAALGLDNSVMSFANVCALVSARLSDQLHLSVDSAHARVLSIAVSPSVPIGYESCAHASSISALPDRFNSTVIISDVTEGPSPETQAFIQMEKERKAKEQAEQSDNRSFIQKYWMYIVPVVLFLMLSGAMNPEAGQQR